MESKGHGIYQGWLHNGRIVVFKMTAAPEREVVDAWYDLVTETTANWPPDKPLLSLYIYTTPDQSLTPYARSRIEETYDAVPPGMKVFAAAVVVDTMAVQTASAFLRDRNWRNPDIVERVFTDETEAIQWLEAFIDTD